MKLIANTPDNCVLTNAFMRNDNPHDDHVIKYLKNMRSMDQSVVTQYFHRSTKIIMRMRELGYDTDAAWNNVDVKFVEECILQNRLNEVIPTISGILSNLESLYGVV